MPTPSLPRLLDVVPVMPVVVLHRGKERDRHVWTGDEHDPSVLAGVLGANPGEVRALLADPGPPVDVLSAMTRVLGLPSQVARVLSGVPVPLSA